VTITVPVAELEGYREDAVDMTLDSA